MTEMLIKIEGLAVSQGPPEPPEAFRLLVSKKFDFESPPAYAGILILTGVDSPPLHAIFSHIVSLLRLLFWYITRFLVDPITVHKNL